MLISLISSSNTKGFVKLCISSIMFVDIYLLCHNLKIREQHKTYTK